jgi:hypothetical protein
MKVSGTIRTLASPTPATTASARPPGEEKARHEIGRPLR